MDVSDQELALFNAAVKEHSTYDFTNYSVKSIKRRLAKVLSDFSLDINTLVKKIKTNDDFIEDVVKDITVNTTELFRDPEVWQSLRYKILPKLAENDVINIWHAGCSTGQEVYSMLILLNEMGLFDKAKVYASDINTDVLDKAKRGVYKYRFNINYLDNFDKVIRENPYNYDEYREVPYSKYFRIDKNKDIIKVKDFLLDKPNYKKHDLVKGDPLLSIKYDIVFCRNVIIYFNYKLQNTVFDFFQKNIYEKGYLVLGMQEFIIGPMATYFERNGHAYIKKERFV